MAMPHPSGGWTVADALALPDDGKRYEVVDGELLVTPAPSYTHQRAVGAMYRRLFDYVEVHRVGVALTSPADIALDDRTLVQPDVFVAPCRDGEPPHSWQDIENLVLAVEVLSPSTARADRQIKRHRYQRHGVTEYWIVDCDGRLVERWRPADDRPELVLDLEEIFREVWQESSRPS
jgi:Uma2 family endonuclease